MTDNEIRKALERCSTTYTCGDCPYYCDVENCPDPLMNDALDLINRQKAEIERLTETLDGETTENMRLKHEIEKLGNDFVNVTKIAKSEAIKEFAERLKEYELCMFCSFPNNRSLGCEQYIVLSDYIDNLVKEMTEVETNQIKEDEGK